MMLPDIEQNIDRSRRSGALSSKAIVYFPGTTTPTHDGDA
jgi:hypothetical protein